MVKERFLNGVKWTSISSVASVLIQVGQMAILARLLDPVAFGSIAIALVVIDFCYMFLDLGISNAIIFKKEVSKNQLSSLFWLNVFSGSALFVLIFLGAPLIADFYKTSELTNIIRWVGVSFLIRPLEMQNIALLRKGYFFKSIAKCQIAAMTISFLAAVFAAFMGLGVWSLVILYLVNATVSSVLILVVGYSQYRPAFHFELRDVRPFLKFGFYLTADNLVSFCNRQVDTIIIGKLFSFSILGGYNLAKNFSIKPYSIINPIISQVSFPVLAGIQNEVGVLKNVYLKSLNYLSSINLPIYTFLFIYSSQIILLIFGEKWLFIEPVFKILAVSFALRSVFNPMGSLIMAKGVPRLSFIWNLSQLLLLPPLIYFSASYGIEVVAFCQIVVLAMLFWPSWRFVLRPLADISLGEYANALLRPALTSCILGIMLWLSLLIPVGVPGIQVIIGGLTLAVLYIPVSKRFNKQVVLEIEKQISSSKYFQFVSNSYVMQLIMKI